MVEGIFWAIRGILLQTLLLLALILNKDVEYILPLMGLLTRVTFIDFAPIRLFIFIIYLICLQPKPKVFKIT